MVEKSPHEWAMDFKIIAKFANKIIIYEFHVHKHRTVSEGSKWKFFIHFRTQMVKCREWRTLWAKKNERKRFPQRIIQIFNEFETKKNNKLIQCGKPCSWPVEYNVFIRLRKQLLAILINVFPFAVNITRIKDCARLPYSNPKFLVVEIVEARFRCAIGTSTVTYKCV